MASGARGSGAPLYRGVRDCASKIVRHEGLVSLYGGLLPRSINFGLGSAVFFLVFQRSLVFLNQAFVESVTTA